MSVKLDDFLQAIEQTTPSLSAAEIDRYEQVRRYFSKTSSKSQINGDIIEEVTDELKGDLNRHEDQS